MITWCKQYSASKIFYFILSWFFIVHSGETEKILAATHYKTEKLIEFIQYLVHYCTVMATDSLYHPTCILSISHLS